jgi:hypothetical protein
METAIRKGTKTAMTKALPTVLTKVLMTVLTMGNCRGTKRPAGR